MARQGWILGKKKAKVRKVALMSRNGEAEVALPGILRGNEACTIDGCVARTPQSLCMTLHTARARASFIL